MIKRCEPAQKVSSLQSTTSCADPKLHVQGATRKCNPSSKLGITPLPAKEAMWMGSPSYQVTGRGSNGMETQEGGAKRVYSTGDS